MDETQGYLLLSLLLCATAIAESQVISPNPSFIPTGGNETLTCQHPLYPDGTVRWIQGGLKSLNDVFLDDPRLVMSGSNLSISSFHASELAGEYVCIANPPEDSTHTVVSCPAKVKHAYIQYGFLIQPQDTTTYSGSNIVLRCNPRLSQPPAVITWFYNGEMLDISSDDRMSLAPSGNLYITNVNASHSGSYRCTASNTVSGAVRKSDEALLIVQEVGENVTEILPTFAVEPENTTTVLEGDKVIIECAGQGYPNPIEAWKVPHHIIIPDGLHIDNTGMLIFENVSRSHTGIYICIIEDSQSRKEVARKQIMLDVKVPPHFIFTPPTQLTVRRGGPPVTISCRVMATDSLTLYLLSNGSVLQEENGTDVSLQIPISPPTHHDVTSQILQFMAQNSFGCIQTTVYVTFTDEPMLTESEALPSSIPTTEMMTTPTHNETSDITTTSKLVPDGSGISPVEPILDIMTTLSSVTVNIKEHHVSRCIVTGPNVNDIGVSWLFEGIRDLRSVPIEGIRVSINQEDDRVVADLIFEDVMSIHGGSYVCRGFIISNPSVEVHANISLTVLTTTITTKAYSSTSEKTENYITTISHMTTIPSSTETTIPPTDSHVTEPPPSTTYNEISPTSDGNALKILNPPLNLEAKKDSISGDIQLTWTDPLSGSDLLGGYKINWDTPDRITPSARASLPKEAENIFIISRRRFDPSVILVIYVWGYNIHGDGPLASIRVYPPSSQTTTPSLPIPTETTIPPTDSHVTEPPLSTTYNEISPTSDGNALKILNPPLNLEAIKDPISGDIQLTWTDPLSGSDLLRGYKINWDTPDRITPSARASLPKEAENRFIISRRRFDPSVILVIHVWGYNIHGDGPFASIRVYPPSSQTTTPSVPITTPSTPPTLYPPVVPCEATAIDPSIISLHVPEVLTRHNPPFLDLMTRCAEADSVVTMKIPPSNYTIRQALPDCSYTIEITSPTRLAACQVNTPDGQTDIKAAVKRFVNGTILLTWELPPDIRGSNRLSIEVNWGKGWIPVTAGLHTPVHFEPKLEYQVQLRFQQEEWESVLDITIPPADAEKEESRASQTEIIFVYGIIFLSVAIGCIILVVIILGLKYVQWSRRENDKVTNYREKNKEDFLRMSLKRSSMKSRKSITTDV